MNRIKCSRCGLVDAASSSSCRRCGQEFAGSARSTNSPRSPREAANNSSWLYTLLFLAFVGGGAYYLLSGVERSYEDVKANEANRIAAQPKATAAPLSRSEFEQGQKQNFKNAIQNSQGLAEADKRLAETQKLMQPASNAARE